MGEKSQFEKDLEKLNELTELANVLNQLAEEAVRTGLRVELEVHTPYTYIHEGVFLEVPQIRISVFRQIIVKR